MKGSTPQVQTTTTSPDKGTQAYVSGNRGVAQDINNMKMPGLDPSTIQAIQAWMNASNFGQQGMSALTGGPNPFMNSYMEGMNPVFDKLRQQSLNAARQNMTGQGAFGGSRTGVAEGTALGDVANTQAGFNYQGFQDAMNRAMQAANLGMGANAALFNAGDYLQNRQRNWNLQGLGALESAIGPYGQTQQTQIPMQSSPLLGLAGLIPGIGQFLGPLASILNQGGGYQPPSSSTLQGYGAGAQPGPWERP